MALQARDESVSDTPATASTISVAPNLAPAAAVSKAQALVSSSPPAETISTWSGSDATLTPEIISVLPADPSHADLILPASNVMTPTSGSSEQPCAEQRPEQQRRPSLQGVPSATGVSWQPVAGLQDESTHWVEGVQVGGTPATHWED
jgi:hypothetical protein